MDTFFCGVQAIASLIAAIIAYVSIRRIPEEMENNRKEMMSNRLMNDLEIEIELGKRKARMSDLRIKAREGARELSSFYENEYNEAIENYLNFFDRLCYFILNGHVEEEDYRTQFRDALSSDIKTMQNQFKPGTSFKNMLELNERWSKM